MADTTVKRQKCVLVKDKSSGETFHVDLKKAEPFKFRDPPNPTKVAYRVEPDLWVWETTNLISGKSYYTTVELLDVAAMFLTVKGSKPPKDLRHTHKYSVSSVCMVDERYVVTYGDGDASLSEIRERLKDRQALLFRLQNGMWVVVDHHCFECTVNGRLSFPHYKLSEEEALDLLQREGYPTGDHPLPEDLWDLCELRRLRACQSADGPSTSEGNVRSNQPITRAVSASATAPPADAPDRSPGRRRGRPSKSDPEKDRKLFDDWKASGQTLKEFARARREDRAKVEDACKRHRTRQSRKR
jgi:hypothetical protein